MLTTGADAPTLNNGDDTINGSINTLSANDTIEDGSTTDNDTMNVELLGGANVGNTTSVKNIENLNFTVLSGNGTIDGTNFSGYDKITSANSTGTLVFTNVSGAADYGMKSSTGGLNLTFTAASVAAGNNALDITLDNVSNGGTITIAAGIETLNLDSTSLVDDVQPIRMRVSAREDLEKDSDIVVTQIRAIDNDRFIQKLASLTHDEMNLLKELLDEVVSSSTFLSKSKNVK